MKSITSKISLTVRNSSSALTEQGNASSISKNAACRMFSTLVCQQRRAPKRTRVSHRITQRVCHTWPHVGRRTAGSTTVAQRIDQQRKRWRGLASAWVSDPNVFSALPVVKDVFEKRNH